MEKRADAVIRWLERMKVSYKSGSVESALMDAECARADLEDLRSDVFAGVMPDRPGKAAGLVLSMSRRILLALVVVMVMVMPVARDIAPVTVPEILTASTPEVPPEITVTPTLPAMTDDAKPLGKKPRKPATQQKRQQPAKPSPKPQPVKVQSDPVKSVAYDKVFSLVQTGQRALKDNKSVVKIK